MESHSLTQALPAKLLVSLASPLPRGLLFPQGIAFLIFQKDSAYLCQVWKGSFLLDVNEKKHQGRPTDRADILSNWVILCSGFLLWNLPTVVQFVLTFKNNILCIFRDTFFKGRLKRGGEILKILKTSHWPLKNSVEKLYSASNVLIGLGVCRLKSTSFEF